VAKSIPKFMENYSILLSTANEIQKISETQGVDKKGIAIDKNKLKKVLISLAAKNSRKVAALAKFNNNDTLLKEVRFSDSDLERMQEVKLIERAQTIYNKADANIGSLAEYGITPETQKVFIDSITALNSALKTPRSGIAEKKKATERLVVLFQTADKALELMDFAVGIVKDEQVGFSTAYYSSRKLVDTNTGTVSLKARATELVNGTPLKGVIFTFTPESTSMSFNGNGKLVKKTAEKGSFQVKNMPAGTYTVLVQKPGYKDKQVSVSISNGERSDLNVTLEK
jgi:ribosomal protein S17E